jgi:hypothetical protein
MSKKKIRNILCCFPRRAVNWDMDQNNNVVLYKPKYENSFLVKYLLPKMKNPYIKISLDKIGSWVWQEINGKKSVEEIGKKLYQEFGKDVEPVFERLGLFINQLAKNKFVILDR